MSGPARRRDRLEATPNVGRAVRSGQAGRERRRAEGRDGGRRTAIGSAKRMPTIRACSEGPFLAGALYQVRDAGSSVTSHDLLGAVLRASMSVAKRCVFLAAVAEIGGAWLIWQGVREHRGLVWVGPGSPPSLRTGSSPRCRTTPTSAGSSPPTAGSSSPARWRGDGRRRVPTRPLRLHRRRRLPRRGGGDHVRPSLTNLVPEPPEPGCWCCGDRTVRASLLQLDGHREVGVCFRCVDRLAKRKRAIERMTRHAPPARGGAVCSSGPGSTAAETVVVMSCADCGCQVERAQIVSPCDAYRDCCCSEVPRRPDD